MPHFKILAFCAATTLAAPSLGQDYSQFRKNFSFEIIGLTGLAFKHRDCELWAVNGTTEITVLSFYGDLLDSITPGIGPITEISIGPTSAIAVNDRNEFHLLDLEGKPLKRLLSANQKRIITGVFWDEIKEEVWFTDATSKRLYNYRDGTAYRVAQLDYIPTDLDRDLITETTFVGGSNFVDRFFENSRARTSYSGSTTTTTLSSDTGSISVAQNNGKTVTRIGNATEPETTTTSNSATSIAIKMIDKTFVGLYLSLNNGRSVEASRTETEEYRNKRPDLVPRSCETS